jgi:hypothetical protein
LAVQVHWAGAAIGQILAERREPHPAPEPRKEEP